MQFVLGNHKDLLADYLELQTSKNKNIYFPNKKINIDRWMSELNDHQTVLDFFSDGIHPSELTYELWAKESVQFLKDSDLNFS